MRKFRHGQEGFTGFDIAIHLPLRQAGNGQARPSRRALGVLAIRPGFAAYPESRTRTGQANPRRGASTSLTITGIGVTDRPRHISKSAALDSGKSANREEDRAARLAAALRANLRRRKAAAQRDPAPSEDHDAGDPAGPSVRGPDED